MIARSFVFAGFLFVLYNLVLFAPPLRGRFVEQSQWQANIIKAQEYSKVHAEKRGVIVGSSLAARFSTTSLKDDFYSLAFSGDGPFTGLEIIRCDATPPALVLIESNFILRRENCAVLANLSRPGVSTLRRWLPALNERYQPAGFIAGKVGEKVLHWAVCFGHALLPRNNACAPAVSPANEAELRTIQLATHKAEYQILPSLAELDQQIIKLQERVVELEDRGCRCIFVEMPIDVSLAQLPLPALIRRRVHEAFSSHVWIQPEANVDYVTVDGLHLAGSQAEAYAEHIRTVLREKRVWTEAR